MLQPFDDRDGFIWMNGSLRPWNDAKVHVLTHGLHYASSVFEGERAYNGVIFKGTQHSQRLHASAKYLDFTVPYSIDELNAAKAETMKAQGMTDCYLRAFAWRGAEAMGISGTRSKIHVAIAAWAWPNFYGEERFKGVRLDIARWRRPDPATAPCHAKAAGLYMICTISRNEAEYKGLSDAMMLDYRGYIAEATAANIFFVKEGKVHTPIADCFLNGITRQTVIGMLQAKGIEVVERHILPDELSSFEQCWLTGTAAEITPVAEIGTYKFTVGALCRDITKAYEDLVRGVSVSA